MPFAKRGDGTGWNCIVISSKYFPYNAPVIFALQMVNLILSKTEMEYLGTVLASDGKTGRELIRRIGAAKGDLIALAKVWKHSTLSQSRKRDIYVALIESKLLYSLSSVCLNVAEQRKLNGFQNRCLRQITGIKPAFISRISNAEVLRRSNHGGATTLLQKRQLHLFDKVLASPEGHPLRSASFIPNTSWPATDRYIRRQGRPCKEWVPETMKLTRR